jgi:chromosome segregation protein
MYTANAEVKRLESEINHVRDSRARLEARLGQLEVENGHWSGELKRVEEEEFRWKSLLENSRERALTAGARHEEAAARLPEAEGAVQAAGHQVAEARKALNEAEQGVRLAEADRGHAIRALDNLAQRRARLEQERAALGQPDPVQLAAAQEAEARAEDELAQQQQRLGEFQQSLPALEAALRGARERLQGAHRQLTESRARRDALQQLQSKVQQSGEIGDWLRQQNLAEAQPLWRAIQVESGWETAVEAVLRERLAALAADSATAQRALAVPPPQIVSLALDNRNGNDLPPSPLPEDGGDGVSLRSKGLAGPDSLRAKVRCDDAKWAGVLDDWLAGVDCANSADELAAATGGVKVSREGHLRSPHGLTLYVPDARTHGVIERQREIEELAALIEARELEEEAAREAQQETERQLAEGQQQLAEARRAAQEAQQRLHAAHVEALKLTQAQARFEERAGQIDRDLEEIGRGETTERAEQERADAEALSCREQLEAVRARLEEALDQQRQKDVALREARALEHQLAREAQEAGFSERECLSKLEDNARAADTARTQLARVTSETEAARTEVAGISDAVLQEQLQSALSGRQGREGLLGERRNALEAAAAELRGLDEQRMKLEQGLQPARDRITAIKLKQQEAHLNEEQFQQRLTEVGADETALAADLVPGLRESALAGDIARLAAEIEALGPVNLAALEELAVAEERKGFLDAQSTDLATAINTLEDAIRRIDRETREQLQQTYDAVNGHFGTLFPQLFGGGEARLILTGDEILDAGIQIMAQPPGKKNSTIHLLSGGEKALTATALVFALFQLNPAPFCMLDEVDAPLDDSNTERFCELVKRMSPQTQFIFITHNKIAMEMAQQLIGVTMQEQGVSRVVEVDVQEALLMTKEAA